MKPDRVMICFESTLFDVAGSSGRYLVGATALPDESGATEWMLQILRSRSIRERLRGEGRIGTADPLVRRIEAWVRELAGETEVVVEVVDDRGRAIAREA